MKTTFTDFLKNQHTPKCFVTSSEWCNSHNIAVSSLLAIGGLGGLVFAFNNWGILAALYIALIIIPLLLGMAGQIGFKWVILWEIIMLLPIGIIILIFFGGAILTLFRKGN